MTSVADFLADNRKPDVELDFANRYLLPDPETGEVIPWTRVTTHANAVKETFGINVWNLRNAARGFAVRPDLVMSVLADPTNKKVVDKAIADAQEHAGSTVAATMGTAWHRMVERVNRGEDTSDLPEHIQARLDRYRKLLDRYGLVALHPETIVCVPELGVAGTLDMVLTHAEQAWVADLKTGKDLAPAWTEIAIQLALYANASLMWNPAEKRWEPMNPVSRTEAIVIHMPAQGDEITLQSVDIAAGWRAANELCSAVRAWRNRRDLATPFELPAAPPAASVSSPIGPVPAGERESTPPPVVGNGDRADRADWISNRLHALAPNERARKLVGLRWPDGVTVKPPWTHEQMSALADMLDDVERDVEASFGDSDPAAAAAPPATAPEPEVWQLAPDWKIDDDGELAADEDVAGLAEIVAFLDDAGQARLRALIRDGATHERPFGAKPMTRRMWACARAALSVVSHTDNDTEARNLVHHVVHEHTGDWGERWVTGAVIGSLSIELAEALSDFADAPF